MTSELPASPSSPSAVVLAQDVSAAYRTGCAQPAATVLQWVYTNNPFYLLSACLFVYGTKLLFRPDASDVLFQRGTVSYIDPWNLMFCLGGITLLMAVTAVGIVRWGRVWDDARSLILIVLLMFLAIAVSFDEIVTWLAAEPEGISAVLTMAGVQCVFVFGVTEFLLCGLPVRLTAGYRIPLHGLLLLFIAWPMLLLPELTHLTQDMGRWLIAAFPAACGLIVLGLLPAVRSGSRRVRDSGTPWTWPWYPWTAFVFLGIAVVFRSYSLTISFDTTLPGSSYWDTAFGLYFFVPLLLAVLLLLLEISIVERLPRLQTGVLLAAPGLLIVAYPWIVPWTRLITYAAFAAEVTETIGSPVFLTLMGLTLFYGWAWWRGVAHGQTGLAAMLLLAVFVRQDSFGPHLTPPRIADANVWPLLLLSALLVGTGVRRRRSRDLLGGLCALSVAIGLLTQQSVAEPFRGVVMCHLLLGSVLVTGGCFRDTFAAGLRIAGAPLLWLTVLCTAVIGIREHIAPMWLSAYLSAGVLTSLVCGWLMAEPLYILLTKVVLSTGAVVAAGLGMHAFLTMRLPPGVRPVVLGGTSFLMALLISTRKARLLRHSRERSRTP